MVQPINIIAEIGFNHGGNLSLAKAMIKSAATAGASTVKFQTYRAEDIVMRSSEHFATIAEGELSLYQHKELIRITEDCGMQFLSTPFGFKGVEMLEALGVRAYKVASMDVTFMPMLRMIGETGKPVYLSTGMANVVEIHEAITMLEDNGCPEVTILH